MTTANNPCVTVIQASDPPRVGKTYRLGKDQQLAKTSIASIVAGVATTVEASPANMVER
jgi:hypothetical protein